VASDRVQAVALQPVAQEMPLAVHLAKEVRSFLAEIGRQNALVRRLPEQRPACRAFLADDVIDQAVHAIARHFNAASMFERDGRMLKCRGHDPDGAETDAAELARADPLAIGTSPSRPSDPSRPHRRILLSFAQFEREVLMRPNVPRYNSTGSSTATRRQEHAPNVKQWLTA
jgi:hypothetical protein